MNRFNITAFENLVTKTYGKTIWNIVLDKVNTVNCGKLNTNESLDQKVISDLILCISSETGASIEDVVIEIDSLDFYSD